MSSVIFQIESGTFRLKVVDKAEAGYSDTWQAPGGKTVDVVTAADYDAGSAAWGCQATSGALVAAPNVTTVEVPATFCEPAQSVPQPATTSYTLDMTFLQDPNVVQGINRFLFEHDTEEAYFFYGLDGDNPPKMIGRLRLIAGTIGGAARTTLTFDVSLPLSRKPDVEFGDATSSEVVEGGGATAATGATAGVPGSWTPTGSTPPATVADLIAGTPHAVTASPTTAWTTGQYVQTQAAGTGGRAHWSGSAWVSGATP